MDKGMKENPWINRGLSAVFAIGMAVSGYFLNGTMQKIQEIEKRVYTMELASATTNGNRFTSGDWTSAKTILDNERLQMDRRLIKLEESIPNIKDSLTEIKLMIKENHYGQNQ